MSDLSSSRSLFIIFLVFATVFVAESVIPPGDFDVVRKYAEIATSKPKFVLAEAVHQNITSRVIIDIRQQADYQQGHIEGAINIP